MLRKCHLKNLTWFKIGGEADFMYAESIDDLRKCLIFAKSQNREISIIGSGSNILATSNSIKNIIIKLGGGFNYTKLYGNMITAGASTLDAEVAKFALKNGISGLEFLITIPGTVGGALAMNAGSYGSDISLVLQSAKLLNSNGEIKEMGIEDIGYQYRGNGLPKGYVFLEGSFIGIEGNREKIEALMKDMLYIKSETQPTRAKTCGSFFKNPQNYKAWQLIDNSGLRNFAIGDAEISQKHCNFIVNAGNATSYDVELLYKTIQRKVKNCYNVDLELEVILID